MKGGVEEGEEGGRRKKERRGERGGRRGRCQRAPYEPSDGVVEEIGVLSRLNGL